MKSQVFCKILLLFFLLALSIQGCGGGGKVQASQASPDPNARSSGILDATFNASGVNTSGVLSFQFSTNSVATATLKAVAIQSDGKILTVGGANDRVALGGFALARIKQDGNLDNSFGGIGKVFTMVGNTYNGFGVANAVAIQPDGKIVVAGDYFAVIRYNIDGSIDGTFNEVNVASSNVIDYNLPDNFPNLYSAKSIAIQSDGKIIVVGTDGRINAGIVMRFNADGTPDLTFGSSGQLVTVLNQANSVAIQSDDKILVAGSASLGGVNTGFAIARYNKDGSLDTTFNGTTGTLVTALGSYLRSNPESMLGQITATTSTVYTIAIQSDGKIVAGGEAYMPDPDTTSNGFGNYNTLARFNDDGSLDTSFNTTGKLISVGAFHTSVRSIAIQSDNKIVSVGLTNEYSDCYTPMRYNADGSLDKTFNKSTNRTYVEMLTGASSVAIQSDGNIVVAYTPELGWLNTFNIGRYCR